MIFRPRYLSAILLAACAIAFSPPALAEGDAAVGQVKSNQCIGCHEISRYKTTFPVVYTVPKIRGQSPLYLEAALKAYRDGSRAHPSMEAIAVSLSDEDIADLAAYYGGEIAAEDSGNDGESPESVDALLPICATCHGAAGNRPIANYPKLAGQHADYLRESLLAYKRGADGESRGIGGWRNHAVMMQQILLIPAEEYAARSSQLAEYFAAQTGDLE